MPWSFRWCAPTAQVSIARPFPKSPSRAFGYDSQICSTLPSRQVPNLAGLARTCEIFAASRLVVPDARVLTNPAFSKISTGAEQWLPIEDVDEKELLPWIRNAKRRGYTLVGVEQTNNSVCLTKVRSRHCLSAPSDE